MSPPCVRWRAEAGPIQRRATCPITSDGAILRSALAVSTPRMRSPPRACGRSSMVEHQPSKLNVARSSRVARCLPWPANRPQLLSAPTLTASSASSAIRLVLSGSDPEVQRSPAVGTSIGTSGNAGWRSSPVVPVARRRSVCGSSSRGSSGRTSSAPATSSSLGSVYVFIVRSSTL